MFSVTHQSTMLEIISYVVEYMVGFIPDQLEKAVEAERIQSCAIFKLKRPIRS